MVRCEPGRRPRGVKRRVAVVGLGIAGATAAHFLSKHHDVVGFESAPEAGLHTHSVNTEQYRFDMPLRAVSPHYYPNLFALYQYLGLTLHPVNYQNTGVDAATGDTYFQYKNFLLGRFALSVPMLRSATVLISLRIVLDYLWFVFATPFDLWKHPSPSTSASSTGATTTTTNVSSTSATTLVPPNIRTQSLHEYLVANRYSEAFEQRFVLPVLSTLLSCSYEQTADYPADYIAEFFCSRRTTFFTGWNRVQEGVQEVSARLLRGVECHYSAKIISIKRIAAAGAASAAPSGRVEIIVEGRPEPMFFDDVIIATESNVVPRILKDVSDVEKQMLSGVSSFTADIVAHLDAALMPKQTSTWSGLNYFSRVEDAADVAEERQNGIGKSGGALRQRHSEAGDRNSGASTPTNKRRHTAQDAPVGVAPYNASMTSAHLNEFSTKQMGKNVFETWNPYSPPDAGKVIKQVTMSRAVWTVAGRAAFDALAPRCQGRDGVWYAGSYASPGVTLLEQAVHSALDVAMDFGVGLPMDVRPTLELYRVAVVFAFVLRVVAWILAPFARIISVVLRLIGLR